MPKRGLVALGSLCGCAIACAASAQTPVAFVRIKVAPLDQALKSFARQTGAELLYDRGQVEGLQALPVDGRLTPEDALRQLVAGTALKVRRADSGALLLEPTAAPPLAEPDAAAPELLVIGRRTQNADIQRFETDVQPYQVRTGEELEHAHRDTIDDYFRSRITADTQALPPILGNSGETRSSIDLRGLGADNTLVLVDGRRMPGIAAAGFDFGQADINSIPLSAIKRVETLTGASGGIYGFGALGGVVNVILDRDTRGLKLTVREGLTSRGDAHRRSLEANFGHTSGDGRTDVTVSAGWTRSTPLRIGQRDYLATDRKEAAANYPAYVVSAYSNGTAGGNSAGVFSSLFEPLTFKPQYGGATIASGYTFLPAGFSGGESSLASGLTQHQGQLDYSLPPGTASSSLGSWSPWSAALLFNARHRFGESVELYVDAVVLANRGKSINPSETGQLLVFPESPVDPFLQSISVTYPTPGAGARISRRFETRRYSTGLTYSLPFDWRGAAELSWGAWHYAHDITTNFYLGTPFALFGAPSDLEFKPLGDWAAFQRALAEQKAQIRSTASYRTNFQEQSARFAGPLFRTSAGPTTLTITADRYRQALPSWSSVTVRDFGDDPMETTTEPPQSSTTVAFHAELRSRLFGSEAPLPLLRELEVQLAAHRDRRVDHFSLTDPLSERSAPTSATFSAVAYTAGAKVSPLPWLLLRGSFATGQVPPPHAYLEEGALPDYPAAAVNDPKRGGYNFDTEDTFLLLDGGNRNLAPIRASTLSLGAILTPFGPGGARVSFDFSHIRRTHDVVTFFSQTILANEDAVPGRVIRAPLTDEDRAKGYTGGQIIEIDARAANAASLDVETLDAHLVWPMQVLGGHLQLRADATDYIRNRSRGLLQQTVEHVGYQTSPLKWRLNGGGEWTKGPLTLGGNVQYFGSYRVYPAPDLTGFTIDPVVLKHLQGSLRVPPQKYVDLFASWRIPLRRSSGDLTVELGVVNVFDAAPPRETTFYVASPSAQGFSNYGDPRRRRFELTLATKF